jgi:glutamate-1-semialdehyde 2,1-aminomutase
MTQTIVGTERSRQAFARAQKVMPGGVNSPVRSCSSVDRQPLFIDEAYGAHIFDVDGNCYLDYVGSWGPMIIGHRHPRIVEAINVAAEKGTSFGAPCPAEVELAELICQIVPSIDMVRMVNSGTEATMSALRLARAFTGRDKVIKLDGCYHGHADSFLVKAGSGLATLGISSSAGVPAAFAELTLSLPFNNLELVEETFNKQKGQIAAVILEPAIGNAGLILPKEGFLSGLRELCTAYGALLIFDEVMTGFRVALGGAQELWGVTPDLTCLGKIIGGGLPVGAYGGRRDIMEMVAPLGTVYQAGTLSGNPLAMAAGLAQLKILQLPHTYEQLHQRTQRLAEGLSEIASLSSVPFQVVYITGMLSVFFTKTKVFDLAAAQTADTVTFAKFWQALLSKGIYWPPSQFEAAFMSLVHSKKDIDQTLEAFESSLAQL